MKAVLPWLQSLPKWTRVPVSAAVFVLLPVLVLVVLLPALVLVVLLLAIAQAAWEMAYEIIYDD